MRPVRPTASFCVPLASPMFGVCWLKPASLVTSTPTLGQHPLSTHLQLLGEEQGFYAGDRQRARASYTYIFTELRATGLIRS